MQMIPCIFHTLQKLGIFLAFSILCNFPSLYFHSPITISMSTSSSGQVSTINALAVPCDSNIARLSTTRAKSASFNDVGYI